MRKTGNAYSRKKTRWNNNNKNMMKKKSNGINKDERDEMKLNKEHCHNDRNFSGSTAIGNEMSCRGNIGKFYEHLCVQTAAPRSHFLDCSYFCRQAVIFGEVIMAANDIVRRVAAAAVLTVTVTAPPTTTTKNNSHRVTDVI